LELQNQLVRYERQVARQTVQHEEVTEGVLSDLLPDLARIVDTSGTVFLRDWEVTQDELLLKCAAKVTVLYLTEEDSRLYCMEMPLSFTHRMEVRGVTPGCEVLCSVRLLSADARILGPRRAAIRLQAVLSPRVYVPAEESCPVGVTDGEGVCLRYTALPYRAVMGAAYKNFTLVEDVDIPEDFGALQSVLRAELRLRETDVKLLPGRAVVKAEAELIALCETVEGGSRRMQHRFGFSQMIDLAGAEEGLFPAVEFTLRSLELDPALDLSGDSRYLSLSAGVILNLELSRQEEIRVLSDLYGTRQEIRPSYRELRLYGSGEMQSCPASARERIEPAVAAVRILDWQVQVDTEAELLPEEGQGSLGTMVCLLYEGEDGGIYSASRRVPLRFALTQAIPSAAVWADAPELSAVISGGGIDLRLEATVSLKTGEETAVTVVESMEPGEAYAPDGYTGLSVLLRRADGAESLWQIAREYHVDADALSQANHLERDSIPESGALLLIPMRK